MLAKSAIFDWILSTNPSDYAWLPKGLHHSMHKHSGTRFTNSTDLSLLVCFQDYFNKLWRYVRPPKKQKEQVLEVIALALLNISPHDQRERQKKRKASSKASLVQMFCVQIVCCVFHSANHLPLLASRAESSNAFGCVMCLRCFQLNMICIDEMNCKSWTTSSSFLH